MGIKELTLSSQSAPKSGNTVYEGFETISIPGDGSIFVLPDGVGSMNECIINLSATDGSGTILWSSSPIDVIKAGGGIWNIWTNGTATNIKKSSILAVVNGYKALNYNGTIDIEIKVQ